MHLISNTIRYCILKTEMILFWINSFWFWQMYRWIQILFKHIPQQRLSSVTLNLNAISMSQLLVDFMNFILLFCWLSKDATNNTYVFIHLKSTIIFFFKFISGRLLNIHINKASINSTIENNLFNKWQQFYEIIHY